jgi:hypothetical protein
MTMAAPAGGRQMQRAARRQGWLGTRRPLAVGLVLAAGVVLSACGEAQPGVAASVDEQTLSVEEVHSQTNAFFESYPEAEGQAPPLRVAQIQIQNWVRGRVVDEIGKAYGLEPTPGDLEQFANENYQGMEAFTQAVANAAVPANREDLVMAELRSFWIQNAVRELLREELGLDEGQNDELDIATQDVNEEFSAAADIAVNPRFGTWDDVATVVVETDGSLSIVHTEPGTEAPLPAPGG